MHEHTHSSSGESDRFDFAIIGGGAAGALVALQLLRAASAGTRIALIEPGTPGRGVAYGSGDPAHVLNVPASGMSAYGDAPADFVEFLRMREGDVDAAAFRPRRDYADYLATRLREAVAASPASFTHVAETATAAVPTDDAVVITLADGGTVKASRAVLATGNHPRRLPFNIDGDGCVLQAWDGTALARIGVADDVAIIGSGLSMVDVVLALEARGHQGRITALSRHGLAPLAHRREKRKLHLDVHGLEAMRLHRRVRVLREIAREAMNAGHGWQDLMDTLRHHVRELWQTLAPEEQRRFLRHGVRHWDIHRHRIAPQVDVQLAARREAGGFDILAARVTRAVAAGDGICVSLEPRGGGSEVLRAHWLVNATGIETRASRFTDPLLASLLRDGHARPGPHDLGFDTRADGALLDASGIAQPSIAAIGSLRLGNLWEATAVPDLRVDAAALANRWLSGLRSD